MNISIYAGLAGI